MKSTVTGGGLFRKYAAVLILLVGGMLLLSSLVGIYFAYQETKATLLGLERQQTLAAASRIGQLVTRIEWQLSAVMQVPFDDPRMARAQREIDFVRLLRDVPAITEIVQLDSTGKVQLLVSRFAPNEIGSQRGLAQDPRYVRTRIGRTYFGPVYFRNESEPHLTIAVPWAMGRRKSRRPKSTSTRSGRSSRKRALARRATYTSSTSTGISSPIPT
jgi:hypothetical protein